eukprot:SAG11_NODE_33994_length_274_cov_0.857143_2_plen_31_part_01
MWLWLVIIPAAQTRDMPVGETLKEVLRALFF